MFNFILINALKWNNDVKIINSRIILIMLILATCYIVIIHRIISLTIDNNKVNHLFTAKTDLNFRREILDRNGELLAISIPTTSLFAKPGEIDNIDLITQKLEKNLSKVSSQVLIQNLSSNKKFVWIKHNLTLKEEEQINNLGVLGLYFKNWQKRFYPYSNLLSHVLGYVDIEGQGIAGLEKKLNTTLTNKSDPILQTTLDINLQSIVNEELDEGIKKFDALGGVGVIVDVTNGEILSLVSKPDFDPHNINQQKKETLFNKASLGNYELGSIFKSIILAIALDAKKISINNMYDLSKFKVLNYDIVDYKKQAGWHSVKDIFINSSNIGMAKIALETGQNIIKDYFNKLGLLAPLSYLEIAEKSRPMFPSSYAWQDIDLVTMSYGYRLSISPLHFIQAMIPVVNGGLLYHLTLIKKDNYLEERIFKKETSEKMRKLLRMVVTSGTGKAAEVDGYIIGGKTGTSNKIINKHYSRKNRFSSFIAMFPSTSPKYMIFVMLDDPQGIKETYGLATSAYTVAPIIKKIIQRMIVIYNIKCYKSTLGF